jgi:hypothetical protein
MQSDWELGLGHRNGRWRRHSWAIGVKQDVYTTPCLGGQLSPCFIPLMLHENAGPNVASLLNFQNKTEVPIFIWSLLTCKHYNSKTICVSKTVHGSPILASDLPLNHTDFAVGYAQGSWVPLTWKAIDSNSGSIPIKNIIALTRCINVLYYYSELPEAG